MKKIPYMPKMLEPPNIQFLLLFHSKPGFHGPRISIVRESPDRQGRHWRHTAALRRPKTAGSMADFSDKRKTW